MWILWETFISQRFLPSTFSRVFSSKMRYPPNSQIMKAHFVSFTRKLFKRENQLTWFSQLNENTQLVWGRSAFSAHCVMKLSLFYVVKRVNLYTSRCNVVQCNELFCVLNDCKRNLQLWAWAACDVMMTSLSNSLCVKSKR